MKLCEICFKEFPYQEYCCSGIDNACGCRGEQLPPICESCNEKILAIDVICGDCCECAIKELYKTCEETLKCETFKIMWREFYES
jgi:hypothetical protein